VSPADGEIATMFPTGHAFGVRTADGLEVLVHIGLNTVEMKGEGFTAHKKQGDKVKAGETVVSFDLELCRKKATSLISPVVITNMEIVKSLETTKSGKVAVGDTLMNVEISD
jgi:sugar PTS system EIIA component